MTNCLEEIAAALTYADALDLASGEEITADAIHGVTGCIGSALKSLGFVVLPGLFIIATLNAFIGRDYFDFVPGIAGFAAWLFWFGTSINRVSLKNGILIISRNLFPRLEFSLQEIRGAGIWDSSFYIFLSGGRKLRLPVLKREESENNGRDLFEILHAVSLSRAREQAGHALESGIDVSVPLSEAPTHRRVPMVVLGLIMLVPAAVVTAIFLAVLLNPVRMHDPRFAEFALCLLAGSAVPAIAGLVVFFDGVIRFFREYRVSNIVLTKSGVRIRGSELPYGETPIWLYRGEGGIEDPDAGIIVVWTEGSGNHLIRPAMENFFLLPFLLKEWAQDAFRVLPINTAPLSFRSMPYRDPLWFYPELPPQPVREDRLDRTENKT